MGAGRARLDFRDTVTFAKVPFDPAWRAPRSLDELAALGPSVVAKLKAKAALAAVSHGNEGPVQVALSPAGTDIRAAGHLANGVPLELGLCTGTPLADHFAAAAPIPLTVIKPSVLRGRRCTMAATAAPPRGHLGVVGRSTADTTTRKRQRPETPTRAALRRS